MAGEIASAYVTLLPSFRGGSAAISRELGGSLDTAGKQGGQRFGGALLGSLKGFAAPMAAAFAGGAILSGLSSSIDAASDLSETVNKSNVIFGANAAAMDAWASTAATKLGLSKQAALDAAAGFGDMFSQIGFAAGDAAKMSQAVVQLSADLGSFNNLPTAEVNDMIAASFRGEYDSLQRVIPNINAARVETEALAMTGKTSAKALTAQEKATATLAIVQKDGARAAGDFARTSDGLANKQKILAARAEDAKAKFGELLVPVKSLAIDGFMRLMDLGGKLAPVFTRIGDGLQGVYDLVVGGDFTSAFGDMFGVSEDAPIVDTILRVREAFVGLKDFVLTGDISGTLLRALGVEEDAPIIDTLVSVRESFSGLADYLTSTIQPAIAGVFGAVGGFIAGVLPVVAGFASALIENLSPLVPSVLGVFSNIGSIITTTMGVVQQVITIALAVIRFVWANWGSQIVGVVTAVASGFVRIISAGVNLVKAVVTTVLAVLKGDWSGAWQGMLSILSGVWGVIKSVVSSAVGVVRSVISLAWAMVKTGTSAAFGAIVSAISGKLSEAVDFVRGLPGRVVSALGDLGGLLRDAGGRLIQGLIDGMLGMIGKIGEVAGSIADKIRGFFPGSPVREGPLTAWNNGGAGRKLVQMGLLDGLSASERDVAAGARKLAAQFDFGARTAPVFSTSGGLRGRDAATGPTVIFKDANVFGTPEDYAKAVDRRLSLRATTLRIGEALA